MWGVRNSSFLSTLLHIDKCGVFPPNSYHPYQAIYDPHIDPYGPYLFFVVLSKQQLFEGINQLLE